MKTAFPETSSLVIRNRQRSCHIRIGVLRHVAAHLLDNLLELRSYELGLQLLSIPRITDLNRRWLNHEGPTDVITFDHQEPGTNLELYGEIYLCPEQARVQARQYRVPWTRELIRHFVHGVLHLQGFDDHSRRDRTRMKRRENELLSALRRDVDLHQLSGDPSPQP